MVPIPPRTRMDSPSPNRGDLDHAASFPRAGRPTPQRQDRLTGGTGLYMNYSIIFTEISFYPATSILLQKIRIIHMTFRIKNSNNSYDISDYT